jgi:hypothetical protein
VCPPPPFCKNVGQITNVVEYSEFLNSSLFISFIQALKRVANLSTQKAVNKRRKIQKLSADSDYGACYGGLGDEEMMDMPEATFQKIQ